MKKLLIGSIIFALLSLTANFVFQPQTFRGTVCFPYQGCTGTSTAPVKGSLLVGTGSIFAHLPVGTTNQFLVASSTKPYGLGWLTLSGSGIFSINGLDTTIQLLAQVDDTNGTLTITSSVDTHTFTLGWTGQLAVSRGGTGWANINLGMIPFGNAGNALATSSALSFNTSASRLSVTFASTTAISGTNANFTNFYGELTGTASGNELPITFNYPLTRATNAISLAFGTTTANTWTALQQFGNATSTLLTFTTAWGNLTGDLIGNASTATTLETARAINGVDFNGSAPITITAASSTLLADVNTWSGANTFSSTLTGTLTGTASGNLTTASINSITKLNAILTGEDVASTTWTGATSIVTLGTIATGAWGADVIGDAYITKTGAWTGTIDGNNFSGGAIGTGQLLYGVGAGDIGEINAGTNGNILSMSGGLPVWIATTTITTLSNLVITSGQVSDWATAWDTRYAATTTNPNIYKEGGFTYATSSATFSGTTTIPIRPFFTATTIASFRCHTDAGTTVVRFGDGTDYMTSWNASSTPGLTAAGANNTLTIGEKWRIEFGTPATNPRSITCSWLYQAK